LNEVVCFQHFYHLDEANCKGAGGRHAPGWDDWLTMIDSFQEPGRVSAKRFAALSFHVPCEGGVDVVERGIGLWG